MRFAALHAVEEARKAVNLKEANVAAELLLQTAEIAAKAIQVAELKALESWETAVKRSLERSMQERNKHDKPSDHSLRPMVGIVT